MTTSLLARSSLHAIKEQQLKSRLQEQLDTTKIFKSLDSDPNTVGAGVIFIDHELTVVTLRNFKPNCRKHPIRLILREPPKKMSVTKYASELKASRRESKLLGEIINTGLSYGAAVISWVVVSGSSLAIPITAGASSTVTYLSTSAGIATGLQCLNSGTRLLGEIFTPNTVDWLDSREWYQAANTALDVISLGGAGAAGATTIKMVQTLRLTTSKSLKEILKGLSRAERKRLTQEIHRLNHPGVSQATLKILSKNGQLTKRYSSQAITNTISLNVKDAVGASLSISGSTYDGSIKTLAIAIYEELGNNDR